MKLAKLILLCVAAAGISGCAHQSLKKAVGLSWTENVDIESVEKAASSSFPEGMTYEQVRKKLGREQQGSQALFILSLGLRPQEPWTIHAYQDQITAYSDGSQFLLLPMSWVHRPAFQLTFFFSPERRLKSVKTDDASTSL